MLFDHFFKDTGASLWFERNVCLVQCARMMLVPVVILKLTVSLLWL